MPYGLSDSDFKLHGCEGRAPVTPTDGAVYAPFARVSWGDYVLTTGNDSFSVGGKKLNTATITSFEFGLSPGDKGYGVDVEVFDAGGRAYKEIIYSLNKTMNKMKEEFGKVSFDWGWVVRYEDNTVDYISAAQKNGVTFGGIFVGLDTEFSGGNVKIKFRLRAPQAKETEASRSAVYGSDDSPRSLSDALIEIFTVHGPFKQVKFLFSDGQEAPGGEGFFFNAGPNNKGPESVWSGRQSNAFFIANSWLADQTTVNKLGIILLHDYKENEILIHEDPGVAGCCKRVVGTFIVNGGNSSPVISFNPSINWPRSFVASGGGASGGANSADQGENLESADSGKEEVGTQTVVAISGNSKDHTDPDEAAAGAVEAQKAHMDTANNNGLSIGGGKPGWTAELKIIGDPSYATILPATTTANDGNEQKPSKGPGLFGASMAIIFINPFYIDNESGDSEDVTPLYWLQDSNVNNIISNKNYLILGVSHQISSGSYTTTFKLKLLLPNVDLPADAKLGNCGFASFNGPLGKSETGQYTYED